MSKITEEQIRQRAYELWEADGQANGDHEAHWEQASRELSGSDDHETSKDEATHDSVALPGVSSTKSAEPEADNKSGDAGPSVSAPLPGISKADTIEPAPKKRSKSA